MNQKLRIKVFHGKIVYEDLEAYRLLLLSLKHDWPYELVIKPIVKPRTDRQNRYYWGVVIDMICYQISGNTSSAEKEEVHRSLVRHFLVEDHVNLVGGVNISSAPPSTTSLSTVEFTEYIESVRKWAAEFLYLNIPDPNQVDFI